MKKVPIKSVRNIGKEFGFDQVIVLSFSRKDGVTNVATWGKTTNDCDEAAQGGNYIKKEILNWPDNYCQTEPNRVTKLKREIKELRKLAKIY
jgi:hypothetical protein